MAEPQAYDDLQRLKEFLHSPWPREPGTLKAISLFSGAGISDAGYALAGFEFVVQVELSGQRAAVGRANFARSKWIEGDVAAVREKAVQAYREATADPLALLVLTPPCQGMSSSNPSRGKRHDGSHRTLEEKNKLILAALPYAHELRPRVIVAENVRPILTLPVEHEGRRGRVIDFFRQGLPDYVVFEGVVNVADYGVPQDRRRAIVVAVRRDEPWLDGLLRERALPWPRATHAEEPGPDELPWVTIRRWLEFMEYERLDAATPETARGTEPLHFVPEYSQAPDRYLQVSHIPPYSGRSAYENSTCPACGFSGVPLKVATCPKCGAVMRNRPYVIGESGPRLVRGFRSSYRRIHADRPAATVTTASSHMGSDYTLHPWENRVLSVLEVSDLQTVPRFFNWSAVKRTKNLYPVRTMIGEAFPSYFTYLHGKVLAALLSGQGVGLDELAKAAGSAERTATVPAAAD